MKSLIYTLFTIFISLPSLFAQTQTEDLSADTLFFQEQAKRYQAWLDRTGFGAVLKVQDVSVDTSLSLYLAFPQEEPDSCSAQWQQLKADFEKEQSLTLEQHLFYQLLHIMEVPQEVANIQMYNTYDLAKNYCFFNAIYFEEGAVKIHTETCRAKQMEINVSPYNLDGIRELSTLEFTQTYKKSSIYEAIMNYAQQRYTKKNCDLRSPEVRELERGELLRFEVIDLCKEVLEDEEDSKICEVLRYFGHPCNWIKREKLEYTISLEQQEEGFLLLVGLTGKYGSGYYKKVRRGAYQDMEPDFEAYLDAYADQMKLEFQKVISNLKAIKP